LYLKFFDGEILSEVLKQSHNGTEAWTEFVCQLYMVVTFRSVGNRLWAGDGNPWRSLIAISCFWLADGYIHVNQPRP